MLFATGRRLLLRPHLKREVLAVQPLLPSLVARFDPSTTVGQWRLSHRRLSRSASVLQANASATGSVDPLAHLELVLFDGIVVKIGGMTANAQQTATSSKVQRALTAISSSNADVATAAARALFQLLLSPKCKNGLVGTPDACKLLVAAIRGHTEAGRHTAAADSGSSSCCLRRCLSHASGGGITIGRWCSQRRVRRFARKQFF